MGNQEGRVRWPRARAVLVVLGAHSTCRLFAPRWKAPSLSALLPCSLGSVFATWCTDDLAVQPGKTAPLVRRSCARSDVLGIHCLSDTLGIPTQDPRRAPCSRC